MPINSCGKSCIAKRIFWQQTSPTAMEDQEKMKLREEIAKLENELKSRQEQLRSTEQVRVIEQARVVAAAAIEQARKNGACWIQ